MLKFVNAKLNLGLNIVRKRVDGYHDLETAFFPIGIYNGSPVNPEPFCDILEIVPVSDSPKKITFHSTGNPIACQQEKNLVVKAAEIFFNNLKELYGESSLKRHGVEIRLEKFIPDGAGLGGGSADATFTLMMLNEISGHPFKNEEIISMAVKLGADCPFFVLNKPVIARGIGEIMKPVEIPDMRGKWVAIVKPNLYISTKEAFSGVKPLNSGINIEEVIQLPVALWREAGLKNDFEPSIFPNHPQLGNIKDLLYDNGALYASMTGSGSSIFGIFATKETAVKTLEGIKQQDSKSFLCFCG